jgi:hypothetical protein
MGIDVYLSWAGQTPEEQAAQDEAYLALDEGSVGYLRESYSGGPYVTKILARDAFESPTREAEIPACVLRERLTSVTEPAYGFNTGDAAVREITRDLENSGASVSHPRPPYTSPMTVEEAVAARYADNPELARTVLRSVRAFVALAEEKELATARPCTVRVEF